MTTMQGWGAAAVLMIAMTAQGQVADNPDGADPRPFVGLAHTAIRVKDLAASSAFYEKLGFERAFTSDKNGVVTQAFYKINDREFFEIYPQLNPEKEPLGFLHLCFDGKDLAPLHTHYLNEGLRPKELRTAGAGNQLFTMEGPEGQNIEYTQYMPGSRHTIDTGKHLGAARVSEELYGVALPMRDLPSAMRFYRQKLGFAALAGREDVLVIPGSTQEIYLFSSDGDTRARSYFAVQEVGKTAAELKRRGLKVKKSGGEATVVDPDGNLVVFRSDRTMP